MTVFGAPYTQLSDVKAGDNVEIHGLIKTDASGKPILQATRVVKKIADAFDRIAGTMNNIDTTAKTFQLGDLLFDFSSAPVLPAGTSLANGQSVFVSVAAGTTVTAGTAIKAKVVRVRDLKAKAANKEAEVGGALSSIDTTAKTFVVNGVTINASAATFLQLGKTFADLKPNSYVVVKGIFGSDQTLHATTIVIRGVTDEQAEENDLHGSILNFVSTANFTVRGVQIDASTAKLDLTQCGGATTLTNGLQVEVQGKLNANGTVTASAVQCEVVQDGHSVVDRFGTVASVDLTAKTLTLTTEQGTLTAQWGNQTLFLNGTSASVKTAAKIVVEGIMTDQTLVLTKVILIQ